MTQIYTKLMTAAWRNSSDEVKQLIAQGSDVNVKYKLGETSLEITKDYGHWQMVVLLKKHY